MDTSRLPHFAGQYVGREKERADIVRLLSDPACRLLTLVGSGGIGKTRLALEAAHAFPTSAHFVALQSLTSLDYIVSTIADAVGFQFSGGVDPKQQLLDYLHEKSWLLVVDNFEHLLEGATLLSDILNAAPAVRILVTSRERLHLIEEWVLEVRGLPYPTGENEAEAERYSAVALFLHHAQRVKLDFTLTDNSRPAVIRICRLVDGMPLGIELAANWVRVLTPEAIAGELERSLDILETPARNVEPRHRTLRAALDQSWQLLSDRECDVFMKLSVFRGGFTRSAAEQVVGASLRTLSALVDKSLLRVDASGRYDLHELLRQYAEEKLGELPTEQVQTRDRHCAYYTTFLQQCLPRIKGSEIKAAFDEIEIELGNVRLSWDWALRYQKVTEIEASLYPLAFFYGERGRYYEGDQAFAQALTVFDDDSPDNTIIRAKIQVCHGTFTSDAGKTQLLEAAAILRRVEPGSYLAWALHCLGVISLTEDFDLPRAADYFHESLALYTELDDQFHRAHVLHWLSGLHQNESVKFNTEDALERARQYAQESLTINQRIDSTRGIAISYIILSDLAYLLGEYQQAFQYARQGLVLFQEIRVYWGVSQTLHTMGRLARALGAYAEARRWVLQSLQFEAEHRFSMFAELNVIQMAHIWLEEGNVERAYELLGLIQQQKQIGEGPHGQGYELFDYLDEELPPYLAAAVERGRARDFDATVKEIITELSQNVESVEASSASPFPQPAADPLTGRELEVMGLVADGFSNGEIAAQLVLTTGTVKWYINQIFSKLHVTSRTQAVERARALGLLV